MRIALEPARQPDVIALIDALDAYQKPLYPPECHYGVDLDALSQPHVLFAVARDAAGVAVACGGLALEADYGEFKRIFTQPSHRGQGLARKLMAVLEAAAIDRGCRHFMLETGNLQHEAIAAYQRCGFQLRGPFGDYPEDPHSVFMEKAVAVEAG